jgi:hypothetical protein
MKVNHYFLRVLLKLFPDARYRSSHRRRHAGLPDVRLVRTLQRDDRRQAVRPSAREGGRQGPNPLQAFPAALSHHRQGELKRHNIQRSDT